MQERGSVRCGDAVAPVLLHAVWRTCNAAPCTPPGRAIGYGRLRCFVRRSRACPAETLASFQAAAADTRPASCTARVLALPAAHRHGCALQTGDAFDLANLLCSLLLGADYNAMVVVGHAVQVRALPTLLQTGWTACAVPNPARDLPSTSLITESGWSAHTLPDWLGSQSFSHS